MRVPTFAPVVLASSLALLAAACGGGGDATDGSTPAETGPGETAPAAGGDEITVTAQNSQFDTAELEFTVGTAYTVTLDNQDDQIPHNIHITVGDTEAMTEPTPGVAQTSTEVTFAAAGEGTFMCDVHPDMKGTVTVS